jgi:hypothetical protein
MDQTGLQEGVVAVTDFIFTRQGRSSGIICLVACYRGFILRKYHF